MLDARPEGNSDVFVVPAAGGAMRQLTNHPAEDARPVFSHEGRWVYFSSARSGRNEIWRVPSSGGEATQITQQSGLSVVASPDGQWLYFLGGTPIGIRRIHPDGTGEEQVLSEPVPFLTYTATPGGLWFVTPPVRERPYWAIKVLRPGETRTREMGKLDFGPGSNLNLSLSPDERYALMTKGDERGTDLQLVENFR